MSLSVQIPVQPDGTWSYQVTPQEALLFGWHIIEARQVDTSGNISAPTAVTFQILIWTWDDLADEVASWDELLQQFDTWDDVAKRNWKQP